MYTQTGFQENTNFSDRIFSVLRLRAENLVIGDGFTCSMSSVDAGEGVESSLVPARPEDLCWLVNVCFEKIWLVEICLEENWLVLWWRGVSSELFDAWLLNYLDDWNAFFHCRLILFAIQTGSLLYLCSFLLSCHFYDYVISWFWWIPYVPSVHPNANLYF